MLKPDVHPLKITFDEAIPPHIAQKFADTLKQLVSTVCQTYFTVDQLELMDDLVFKKIQENRTLGLSDHSESSEKLWAVHRLLVQYIGMKNKQTNERG